MRLTAVRYFRRFRQSYIEKNKKIHWRDKGRHMVVRDLKLPQEAQQRMAGVPVEDMFTTERYREQLVRETDFVDDEWTPPVDLSASLPPGIALQEREGLLFRPATLFSAGEAQAAILAKCSLIHAPPAAQESALATLQLPPDAGYALQLAVLRAHSWANDQDRLPRRFVPHRPIWRPKQEYGILPRNQVRYLLTDLLRYAFLVTQPLDPAALTDRMTVRDALLSTSYAWRGSQIYFRSQHDLAVCGRNPLPAMEEVPSPSVAEVAPLPDIEPISPLIDLRRTRNYSVEEKVPSIGPYRHPHLVVVNLADLPLEWNTFAEPEALYATQEQKNAIGIMSALGIALATARQRFGADKTGELSQPVVSQVVCSDGVHLDFVHFQLNTLDFDGVEGVRNVAWVDGGHALFEKRLPNYALLRQTQFHNLNLEVFKKLLLMYRFGLDASSPPPETRPSS